MVERAEPVCAFGRFRALPRSRMLLADGAPVELGSRAFDVLMALIEAKGALVTKDELLQRVWPGTIVEESNLHVQISALRKALGDDRSIILTVSGRGYRFTVPVADASGAPDLAAARDERRPSATNLPAAVLELIGREGDLAELLDLARAHRLVTVIGAGGIGKTRLALEAARRLLPDFRDGVWLAELAPLSSPASVPATIAAAVGCELGDDGMGLGRVVAALHDKRVVLVLDNCEHVIEIAAQAVDLLLHAAAAMHILATSQEPLGVEGECVYRLPPLEIPATFVASDGEAMHGGAVRLFAERARAADPRFRLDERTGPSVVEIVRRLDGMPLAIELAAARTAALGVEGLAQRLSDRFRLLAGGRRTALPRHQTLRAALDWSYGLLSEAEQTVLRRLAVFAGGFTLEGAGSVAAHGSMSADAVMEHVLDLVGRSLVTVDTSGPVPRYRLLETTRLYALEKLGTSGECDGIARSHALHCREIAETAELSIGTLPIDQWMATYAPEIDNLRQAIDWALGREDDRALGVELSAVGWMLWSLLSLTAEARVRTERALAAVDAHTPKLVAARLWRAAAFLSAGHPRNALPAAERAVTLYRELDDPYELARTLDQLGLTLARLGRPGDAEAALNESRDLFAAAGRQDMRARSLASRGLAYMLAGRHEAAKALLAEAIAESGGTRDEYWGLRALIYLAQVEFQAGEVAQALARARHAVTLSRSQREVWLLGQALCNLASYLLATGETAAAAAALREGLPLVREREYGEIFVALGMYCMAGIALNEGRIERAASLAGYAETYFVNEFGNAEKWIELRPDIARFNARLAAALEPEVLARLKAAGAAWTEGEAIRETLAE